MCLLAVGGDKRYTCRCPNGMNMSADGLNCTGQPFTGQPTPAPVTTSVTTQSAATSKRTELPTGTQKASGGTRPNGSVNKPSKASVTVPTQSPATSNRTEPPSTTQRPSEPGIVARRKGEAIDHLVANVQVPC